MRLGAAMLVALVALGACHQDENASNSERATHMDNVHGAEPVCVRGCGPSGNSKSEPAAKQ